MSQEQWFLGLEEGFPPLRLEEPISSLQLTPFAMKAARSTGTTTVGQLASFLWEKDGSGSPKVCLGQGHIDEMKQKIGQFVGTPPFPYERSIDWASLLRLALSTFESIDRAVIISYSQLQSIVPLSVQETKEAQILLQRESSTAFQKALSRAQKRAIETLPSLIATIGTKLITPLILKRGGIIHTAELKELLFERGSLPDYSTFDTILRLLEAISGKPLLFSDQLFPVRNSFWAINPTYQQLGETLLEEAESMVDIKKGKRTNLHALAFGLARCQVGRWEAWSLDTIKRLLFWHFTAIL